MELTVEMITEFEAYLHEQEKSKATIEKYIRDLKKFYRFLEQEMEVTKEKMISFKQTLVDAYQVSSVNSILAAVNQFLQYIGIADCKVKQVKVQRQMFRRKEEELTREEYQRLILAARETENERIGLLMQAICTTGIRVSEHQFITVEALKEGYLRIYNKGKSRIVFLPKVLGKTLLSYCRKEKITGGPVFITKYGNPMDRSNIWLEMKSLCKKAGVERTKVYPHNLRHLFAYTFYSLEKDLLRLADVLGHSSINTTRIYTASDGTEHRRIMSKLEMALKGGNYGHTTESILRCRRPKRS